MKIEVTELDLSVGTSCLTVPTFLDDPRDRSLGYQLLEVQKVTKGRETVWTTLPFGHSKRDRQVTNSDA